MIETYTSPGAVVLDFCMGSGSFGVAAVNLDSGFIGIENEDKYFQTANLRITEAVNAKLNPKRN